MGDAFFIGVMVMDQWYHNARTIIKEYRLCYQVVNSPGVSEYNSSERLAMCRQRCMAIEAAVNQIPDKVQAQLLRYEFLTLGGNRKLAQTKLMLTNNQYIRIRKQAMRLWWQLVTKQTTQYVKQTQHKIKQLNTK